MTALKAQKQVPEFAPWGFYSHLATSQNPTEKGRRYLHPIHRPENHSGKSI